MIYRARDFAARNPSTDAAGGKCDAWYLQIGKLLTGGQCRDVEALNALENSWRAFVADASSQSEKAVPNAKRVEINHDSDSLFEFIARLRLSGYDYWTGDSGNPEGAQIVSDFDAWQGRVQAWRDWLAKRTGKKTAGHDLPKPDPYEEEPGLFGGISGTLKSAAMLVAVGAGAYLLVSLARR